MLDMEDYLRDTYVNANFHEDYYHSTNEFRDNYQARYHKRPYVGSFITWKWELGELISQAEHDESMNRPEIYKRWFLDLFLRQESDEMLFIMSISDVVVNYRDDFPSSSESRHAGFNPLIISPILGALDIVIPIREYEYQSRMIGLKEHLPIAINVVGLPGTDLDLVEAVR